MTGPTSVESSEVSLLVPHPARIAVLVAAWSEFSPAESLREATSLGLVVGALYQVQTYRSLHPTLVAHGADDGMAGADLSWIKRSLTRHELGLESRL